MKRILVANRGEIAARVLRGAKRAGYETVAVYTDRDPYVRVANRAVHIDSFLDIAQLLDAARASGADAIHPGYGFLSERAAFARAVVEAGLVFIGPRAESIEAMGDKSASKARMIAAGVPCIPGFHERADDDRLADEARRIGFPVMVKASAGGGGRGMRLVHDESTLLADLRAARSEATSAFGDGTLLLERALTSARHVEIQIFGDTHGNVVHLGERDCSIQRRNQKLVEESPSTAVDDELRARMGAAAIRAARSVDYVGAGTVELMLEGRDFYFLEMNTRLQVEHPVTELVYDVDLVDWQLRVAAGEPLPLTQSELDARRRGHAIEVRLCAEDDRFRPQTGEVLAWSAPTNIRVDSGIETGSVVTARYDSLLGKLIAHGRDREEARRRAIAALDQMVLLGVETNRDVLLQILSSDRFASGRFDTRFLHDFAMPALPSWHVALAAIALELDDASRRGLAHWHGWSSCELAASTYVLQRDDVTTTLRMSRRGDRFTTGDETICARLIDEGIAWSRNGVDAIARYLRDGDQLWLDAGLCAVYTDRSLVSTATSSKTSSGIVSARSDGVVVKVGVQVGDRVERGQVVVIVESMKMQIELVAEIAGVVDTVHVVAGDRVRAKRPLVELSVA